MRNTLGWFLAALGVAVAVPASRAAAQLPKKKSLAAAVAKVADTSATVAAAAAVDQALGTNGAPVPAALAGGPCGIGMPGVPTAGGAIVGVAKKKLTKKDDGTTSAVPCGRMPAAVPGGTISAAQVQALYAQQGMKLDPAQAEMIASQFRLQQGMAGMAAAPATAAMPAIAGMGQAYGAGAAPSAGAAGAQMAQTMLAATPVGMAAAALPMAGGLAKGLKGMFGGGPPNAEKMGKKLSEGRLELKQLSYEGTGDEPKGVSQELFAAAVEALKKADGVYAISVPVEEGTDAALAQRRATRIYATLISLGVPAERFTPEGQLPPADDAKPVKKGDARPTIVRAP